MSKVVTVVPVLLCGAVLCAVASASGPSAPPDLERQAIAPDDGWAAVPTAALPSGTTGGSAAAPARVHTVSDRNALVAALAFPDPTPKIIRIDGVIDANVDAEGAPLGCSDYARPDPQTGTVYSLASFLAAYDPATWGRVAPAGPLERARVASAAAQQARVRVRVPANTTIVGIRRDSRMRGAWLDIRPGSTSGNQPMNVIVRNLTLEDTYDCFPQWSPTDGAQGNWNSLYDAISIRNATHVWVDHVRFRNATTPDSQLPTYFGRLFQVHDGLVDVTNESDYVTVSWNRFEGHDKAMLIGSSDGATADRGKLRVTIHHNLFENIAQRAPRVRYGRVHLYNNHHKIDDAGAETYAYAWGVGFESQILAQNNHVRAHEAITPALLIQRFNGQRIQAEGTLLNGVSPRSAIDPVAAYNAANADTLLGTVDWTPPLHGPIEPTRTVPVSVIRGAGPYP